MHRVLLMRMAMFWVRDRLIIPVVDFVRLKRVRARISCRILCGRPLTRVSLVMTCPPVNWALVLISAIELLLLMNVKEPTKLFVAGT